MRLVVGVGVDEQQPAARRRAASIDSSAAGDGLLQHRLRPRGSTASSGVERACASGSSASGPSGVMVMRATLPAGPRPARSVGCRAWLTRPPSTTASDSYPRVSARAPSGSPAARPRSLQPVPAGDRRPVRSLRATAPTRSGRCGRSTSRPVPRRLVADPRGLLARRRRGAAPGRGAGAPRAQPRGRPRASSAFATDRPRPWRPSRCPAGCGSPTSATSRRCASCPRSAR